MKPKQLGGVLRMAWRVDEFALSMTRHCELTRRAGVRSVELFAIWCNETEGICHPDDVTKRNVSGFIYDMAERGLAASTRNGWIVDIRRYVNWCERTTIRAGGGGPLMHRKCLDGIHAAKAPARLPRVLSQDDCRKLMIYTDPDLGHFASARNAVIVEVLYGSGLRCGELANLTLENVSKDLKQLRFVGKGQRERVQPLSLPAQASLKVWLRFRGDKPGWLLTTEKMQRFNAGAIERMVKERAVKCGILADVYPHLLRHSFATHLLEGGASVYEVQLLLGHTDPSTVARYAQVSPVYLRAEYERCDPSQGRWEASELQRQLQSCLPSF